MLVAFIGNFQPNLASEFPGRDVKPWSTETYIALSLEELGHEVIRLQENAVTAEQVANACLDRNVGLLLWQRTWAIAGNGFDMLAKLRRAGIPTAAFHLDLYAGLTRQSGVKVEPWWRCQYVFSADGGSDEFWRANNINHYWSPPGVYGGECYRAEPVRELACEVMFVGSHWRSYHQEWHHRRELLEGLEKRYGPRFRHIDHHTPGGPWRGHRLNQLCASAKVMVGDSLILGYKHANYWSDRIPETLGRGGFLVHPRVRGLETQYNDREHLVLWDLNDWAGLWWAIDYYLSSEGEAKREAIRSAGQEHVKANHTYVHRLRAMLRTMGLPETG